MRTKRKTKTTMRTSLPNAAGSIEPSEAVEVLPDKDLQNQPVQKRGGPAGSLDGADTPSKNGNRKKREP